MPAALSLIKQNRYFIGYAAGRSLQGFYLEFYIVLEEKIKNPVAHPFTIVPGLRRQLLSAMATPCFARMQLIFSRQMAMINLEAEALRLQPLRTSASRLIDLTWNGNIF